MKRIRYRSLVSVLCFAVAEPSVAHGITSLRLLENGRIAGVYQSESGEAIGWVSDVGGYKFHTQDLRGRFIVPFVQAEECILWEAYTPVVWRIDEAGILVETVLDGFVSTQTQTHMFNRNREFELWGLSSDGERVIGLEKRQSTMQSPFGEFELSQSSSVVVWNVKDGSQASAKSTKSSFHSINLPPKFIVCSGGFAFQVVRAKNSGTIEHHDLICFSIESPSNQRVLLSDVYISDMVMLSDDRLQIAVFDGIGLDIFQLSTKDEVSHQQFTLVHKSRIIAHGGDSEALRYAMLSRDYLVTTNPERPDEIQIRLWNVATGLFQDSWFTSLTGSVSLSPRGDLIAIWDNNFVEIRSLDGKLIENFGVSIDPRTGSLERVASEAQN